MAGTGDDPQSASERGPAPPKFHLFPLLPAELRLKIWHLSFEPRVVELHARRSHYAADFKHGGVDHWQSGCTNPAALSACVEARAAALAHYAVRLPLAAADDPFCDRAGNTPADLHRVLYVSPAVDTVVILGELDFDRLNSLLSDFRRRDGGEGAGLRHLAVSARWTYHAGVGATMRLFARTMFRDLDEMVVFMFDERNPPDDWVGGVCSLEDCSSTDYYKRYAMGRGRELRDGNSWMVIGKKELRVMDLSFRTGW